jgi:hypothetical protein
MPTRHRPSAAPKVTRKPMRISEAALALSKKREFKLDPFKGVHSSLHPPGVGPTPDQLRQMALDQGSIISSATPPPLQGWSNAARPPARYQARERSHCGGRRLPSARGRRRPHAKPDRPRGRRRIGLKFWFVCVQEAALLAAAAARLANEATIFLRPGSLIMAIALLGSTHCVVRCSDSGQTSLCRFTRSG